MGTAAKSAHISHSIEEFVDYDSQGHSIVLRRSVEHPGTPLPSSPAKRDTSRNLNDSHLIQNKKNLGSGFGFFSDFKEVRQQLRQKGLISR